MKNKGSFLMNDILDEISRLKVRENATILAHYYQDGEIQELADYTGDSLKLARLATRVESPTIVFCGGRSEEHTSELQSHLNIVCRLLIVKKKRPLLTARKLSRTHTASKD